MNEAESPWRLAYCVWIGCAIVAVLVFGFLVSQHSDIPELHYGDRVYINGGFYEEATGTLVAEEGCAYHIRLSDGRTITEVQWKVKKIEDAK